MRIIHRTSFWLGFSLALGMLLAFAVVAAARSRPAASPAGKSAHSRAVGVPSQEPLAAFSRSHGPSDTMPAAVAASASDLAGSAELPSALRNGSIETAGSRLLLSDLGTAHSSFYAFRSAKGRLCYAITDGPQSCQAPFTVAAPVGWNVYDRDGYGTGAPTEIAGLAPNNVSSVHVVAAEGAHRAILRNNAYYVALPTGASVPTALRVGFAGGESTTIELPALTH